MSFFQLHALGIIDSTNDAAKALADRGAPEGTLVVAEAQSSGRGRQGRTWISPKGNLYASLLLRPGGDVRAAAQLGFAAALAVLEAAESLLPPGQHVSLKWPNDVLLNGAKLAGILLESKGGAAVEWLVLGIGVNLASHPSGTDFPATSLAAVGATVEPADFLPILEERLVAWYETWRRDGFAALRDAWLARAHPVGTLLRVRCGGREDEGRFAGLDAEGRLLFDGAGGRTTIAAADVFAAAT